MIFTDKKGGIAHETDSERLPGADHPLLRQRRSQPRAGRQDDPQELESYKLSLTRKQVAYKIESETPQPDGSLLVMLKRQYNFYSCGAYLD